MCNDPLVAEILSLCAEIHRAEFRLLELISELDCQRPWRHEAMPSCAHWLNAHCGIDLAGAGEGKDRAGVGGAAGGVSGWGTQLFEGPRDHAELDVGRKTRVIPPAVRRGLKVRDRGCRFPGCTNTRFVDGHHITHWADGGATRLDNLVLLCRHHHRLLHEGGYYVVRDGPRFIFCQGDGELVRA
jgi:hypothetical protein